MQIPPSGSLITPKANDLQYATSSHPISRTNDQISCGNQLTLDATMEAVEVLCLWSWELRWEEGQIVSSFSRGLANRNENVIIVDELDIMRAIVLSALLNMDRIG